MSEMKQGGGNDAAAPRCPPHPGFIRGLCFLCGVKVEDTEGGAPELAIGDENEMMEQGGSEAAAALCPPHPGFVSGLCSLCGAKEEDAGGSASGFAVGYTQGALASATTSIGPHASDLETLLRARKLTLILDLDHTLLNSTRLDDFSPKEERNGFTSDTRDDPDRGLFRLEPYGVAKLTKLRPFARGFLEQASSIFEMHVYTLAGRAYARAAVKLLDPDGVYFGKRIVTRVDSTRRGMKSLDVIPGAEFVAAVILDDSDSVWPVNQDNLILMDRYHYFSSTCRKFGYNINSLAEQNRDEREHDGSLAVVLEVLKRVHKGFFDSVLDGAPPDVTEAIREVRRQVLLGCTVAFSWLNDLEDAMHTPMWKLAERLGAVCEVDVGETVTHVVAEDPVTKKAQWARDNNKFLVSTEWIKAASFRWCRQDEQAFPPVEVELCEWNS
ncbi:RNA polymerase II C-terminal domain phosphatase-like 4 [Dichanthelium oligosanthes]|uniref:RNA polymerase II C-terminal domain phosphatase-like n=1 Tax=Dichanthelium oligosanthes TaxID=888268 RepID=A0A1E5W692_9POAL|nr:RNA polymerase II C-terminal domain phosphatase-like 4 [Dichanthelium oligosanthes]